jgi:1-deoxy-D-xylulose-5-phosphate reductoisomerase
VKESAQQITVLGSTGSIGKSTLDVIARHPSRYTVFALSARQDWQTLLQQCQQFKPVYAVLFDDHAVASLRAALRQTGIDTQVLQGDEALVAIASDDRVDCVMAAIVGAAGLPSALAAARAGKRVLLANKESLVMAGSLFMAAVRDHGATLLPIDSEHNAIFQCMPAGYRAGTRAAHVERILLTASGGPFRGWSADALASVTPDQACAHPKWSMGRKISVDSATLMNKGLEIIEACWLFDMPEHLIEVLVHPQSIVHSLVAYADGSVLAQMGQPDMRTPIAYGLAWPARMDAGVERLDLLKAARLEFEAPDGAVFPCLDLARDAFKAGGVAPAYLNAANEVAVAAFLEGRVGFMAIPALVEKALARAPAVTELTLDVLLAADAQARQYVMKELPH